MLSGYLGTSSASLNACWQRSSARRKIVHPFDGREARRRGTQRVPACDQRPRLWSAPTGAIILIENVKVQKIP